MFVKRYYSNLLMKKLVWHAILTEVINYNVNMLILSCFPVKFCTRSLDKEEDQPDMKSMKERTTERKCSNQP